ncbi:hypothetical protein ASG90_07450 [Nocardioides sp. Soil797]|nr:hypothetical protein ASG90_07450 [Nocardioides sp. Soil797]
MLVPVLAAVAVAIRVLDGGPVLFRQPRQGLDRQPFAILKFRTMRDGRVTGIGGLLRRTGLDELPQLINIARGEMRFIGPRPLTAADVRRLEWDSPAHDTRWQVRPGLTGYAQLGTVCDRDVSWSLDEHYAQHRGPAMDLRIVMASVSALLVGKQRAKAWFWR